MLYSCFFSDFCLKHQNANPEFFIFFFFETWMKFWMSLLFLLDKRNLLISFFFFLSWKERRNLLNSDYFRRSKKFICCKKTSIWISDFTGFPVYLWLWIALEELNRLKMLKIQLTFTQILILIDILVVCNKKKCRK